MNIRRDVVPLLLLERMGEILGKTRFQKLMYLLQSKSDELKSRDVLFRYDLHYYGPFSADLEATLNEFAQHNLVAINVSVTSEGHPLYIYRLTGAGRRVLNEAKSLRLVTHDIEKDVDKVMKYYGHKPLRDLIAEAYAEYGR